MPLDASAHHGVRSSDYIRVDTGFCAATANRHLLFSGR